MEKGSLLQQEETVTTDNVLEELFRCRTWKYSLLLLLLPLNALASSPTVFITSFAGNDGLDRLCEEVFSTFGNIFSVRPTTSGLLD